MHWKIKPSWARFCSDKEKSVVTTRLGGQKDLSGGGFVVFHPSHRHGRPGGRWTEQAGRDAKGV
jgi:hypothetical protein